MTTQKQKQPAPNTNSTPSSPTTTTAEVLAEGNEEGTKMETTKTKTTTPTKMMGLQRANSLNGNTSISTLIMMREDDAMILERGFSTIIQPSSAPPTPLDLPMNSSGNPSNEQCAAADIDLVPESPPSLSLGLSQHHVGNDAGESGDNQDCLSPSPSRAAAPLGLDNNDNSNNNDCEASMCLLNSSSISEPPEISSLPKHHPSEDTIAELKPLPNTDSTNRPDPNGTVSSSSRISGNNRHQQLLSTEESSRRFLEVTQFCEAVGETPPASEFELENVIIEDGSSSDGSFTEEEHDDDRDNDDHDLDPDDKEDSTMNEEGQDDFTFRKSSSLTHHTTTHSPSSPLFDLSKSDLHNKNDTAPIPRKHQSNSELHVDRKYSIAALTQNHVMHSSSLNFFNHELPCRNDGMNRFSTIVNQHSPPLGNKNDDNSTADDDTNMVTQSNNVPQSNSGVNDDNSINHNFNQNQPLPPPTSTYKGLQQTTLEMTKRGISRGNYALLHRKAWLEASDKQHRYGANLRLYYNHWENLGYPTIMFFDWLDSIGEAEGCELPNLPECPREVLDSDHVLYITDNEETDKYEITITLPHNLINSDQPSLETVHSAARLMDARGNPVNTGPSGWIFVIRDYKLYGARKVTSKDSNSKGPRFHHSSFFGGKAVAAAGILITDNDGYLTKIYPHSGHYRPGEAHMQRMLFYFHRCGVDLETFEVDMQQILCVSRERRDENTPKGSGAEKMKKAKKTASIELKKAMYVAMFLGHKARLIDEGLFAQILQIRRTHFGSVSEILNLIDNGGFWNQRRRNKSG